MTDFEDIIQRAQKNTPGEDHFHQAVNDVMDSLLPYLQKNQIAGTEKVLESLMVPDRIIQFRVTWQDGADKVHTNTGWRVQYNNAIGPYKGGLRFHPSVSTDIFKFLAFEQTFKNALTGLPMGGGKGGADFDPKQKSDADILRFCQAFMRELYKYIGPDRDVPAGDIGVGGREIGYLFGTYKQITGESESVLTGKNPVFGGSCIRKEATGYGCVYFLEKMLEQQDADLEGKRCLISGSGNVALYTAEKLLERGAKVLTMSDSSGTVVTENGLNKDQWEKIRALKEDRGGRLSELDIDGITYRDGETPWAQEADIAVPCATQNEIDLEAAKTLKDGGIEIICEASNMPLTHDATEYLADKDVLIAPSKAANAGGVAVSGLERSQNAQRLSWNSTKVDEHLKEIMADIHATCTEYGKEDGRIDYIKGANIGGYLKVAQAMAAYGAY